MCVHTWGTLHADVLRVPTVVGAPAWEITIGQVALIASAPHVIHPNHPLALTIADVTTAQERQDEHV